MEARRSSSAAAGPLLGFEPRRLAGPKGHHHHHQRIAAPRWWPHSNRHAVVLWEPYRYFVGCLTPRFDGGLIAPGVCLASAAASAASLAPSKEVSELPRIVCPAPPETKSGQHGSRFFKEPRRGSPQPLGSSVDKRTGWTNFAIFSSAATAVWLVIFTEKDLLKGKTTIEIPLDPELNRTGDIWHIALPNLAPHLLYGYRIDGPNEGKDEASYGHRCNKSRVLLDPYARGVLGRRKFGEIGPELQYGSKGVLGDGPTWPQSACCVPRIEDNFDWEGDTPLNIPLKDLVIYELHVRGFTANPSSEVRAPGTYEGMTEKLDYLHDLGVNCIELLPIHEFNELEYYQVIPGSNTYKVNFWGYSTVGYFAPAARYSAMVERGGGGLEMLNEFRTFVKNCHKRGIEVIMDVVFNHTAEGNHLGPTISFRGIDNQVYYMLAPGGEYYNYSGCGNTLNCNQPIVRRFILDCLRYWVQEMHIDGFRFDLASVLTRAQSVWHPGEVALDGVQCLPHGGGSIVNDYGYMSDGAGVATGTPLSDPAVIEMISEDPVLRNTKLIAEAWDASGLNQVGAFPHYGGRWAEWNGSFRDIARKFIKGTYGAWSGDFASAVCGSPNLYKHGETANEWHHSDGRKWCGGRGPMHSINFITAHDGFTLADLVTYNEKHNDANGESNRDGEIYNHSWNCGIEGPTDDPRINRLRPRQICNFLCALMLSNGVPMLTMGDEYGHTKHGNNNTYCHDSDLNWFDWSAANKQKGSLIRFVKHLLQLRRQREELRRETYVQDGDIEWHGERPWEPDWSETGRLLAFTFNGSKGQGLYVAFNTAHVPRIVNLPSRAGRKWQLIVDTSAPPPCNFLFPDEYLSKEEIRAIRASKSHWLAEDKYPVMEYSCIVLNSIPVSPFDGNEADDDSGSLSKGKGWTSSVGAAMKSFLGQNEDTSA